MTARSDYPIPHASSGSAITQWGLMCDEIDRLRSQNENLKDRVVRAAHADSITKHLDELISTLTTHADAMRNLLAKIGADGFGGIGEFELDDTIAAYNSFVKEC